MAKELTPEQKAQQELVKKAALDAWAEQVEGLKKEFVGNDAAFKEAMEIITSIKDAKSVEEITKQKDKVKALEDTILEMKSELKRKSFRGERKVKSMSGMFTKGARELFEKGAFEKLKNRQLNSLQIKLATKAADNPMSEGTSVVAIGSGIPFSLTQFEPGLTRVSRRRTYLVELVNVAKTISEYIAWVEQTNVDPGNAAMTAEGAAIAAGSFRYTEKNTQAESITHFTKITKRMLDDLSLVQNEIRTELIDILTLKLDAQSLAGNGTSPNLKGISQYARAFSLVGNTVQAANNYDCLIKAILQIRAKGTATTGGEEVINIYEPTDIVLHPSDYADMILTKDTLNRYVQQLMPDLKGDGMDRAIEGCKITQNIGIPIGSYLVMDASKSNIRIREDASVAIGYENDDFTKGLVTLRGELRAAHYIKENHRNAFVYDTFAATTLALQPNP